MPELVSCVNEPMATVTERSSSYVAPADHAAVSAWTALPGLRSVPAAVETLRERKNGLDRAYRLAGVGERGSAVVAKRCALPDAERERGVYEQILPCLPVATVRYYGFVADAANSVGWLFLEDAGDTRYSPRIPSHRELAARWLGVLHTRGAGVARAAALPDRGVVWYRARVEAAISLLEHALARGTIDEAGAKPLARLLKWCETTEARWPDIAGACDAMPSTLVHADFVGENVRVRPHGSALTLLPFDWGTSGWGVPARDLVGIDISRYYATVRDRWPTIEEKDVQRVAQIGRLFRKIAAVHRACMSLPYAPVEKVLSDMRFLLVRA
jgi:hypothetical protein